MGTKMPIQKFHLNKTCKTLLRTAATSLLETPGVNGTSDVAHYFNSLSNQSVRTNTDMNKVLSLLTNFINLYTLETDPEYWFRNTMLPNEFPSENQYDIIQELITVRERQVLLLNKIRKDMGSEMGEIKQSKVLYA